MVVQEEHQLRRKRCANAQEISLCATLNFAMFYMTDVDWAFYRKSRKTRRGRKNRFSLFNHENKL
jgi:hypothetical protein